jgi:hypothetical protein
MLCVFSDRVLEVILVRGPKAFIVAFWDGCCTVAATTGLASVDGLTGACDRSDRCRSLAASCAVLR